MARLLSIRFHYQGMENGCFAIGFSVWLWYVVQRMKHIEPPSFPRPEQEKPERNQNVLPHLLHRELCWVANTQSKNQTARITRWWLHKTIFFNRKYVFLLLSLVPVIWVPEQKLKFTTSPLCLWGEQHCFLSAILKPFRTQGFPHNQVWMNM